MKPILAHHHLEFTKRDLVVIVADTLDEAATKFNRHYHAKPVQPWECAGATALCVVQENGACALLFALPMLCASTICHEVTHATYAMFKHIGIKLTNSSDEAFAYHNDMLFRMVAKLLLKHNISISLLPRK